MSILLGKEVLTFGKEEANQCDQGADRSGGDLQIYGGGVFVDYLQVHR